MSCAPLYDVLPRFRRSTSGARGRPVNLFARPSVEVSTRTSGGVTDRMTRKATSSQGDLLMGTLDLLVLQTLQLGPAHGYAIASTIAQRSDDVLQVEQGSLYPALQRLEDRGWVSSYWGQSESNRRARFYQLTPAGKRQLVAETTRFEQLARAVRRVLRPV